MEEATAFGNNMLEMDMRHYDAAIARWIVVDPVTHHDFSPYQAFDNNPIFWADPSGADSMDSQTDIFGRNRYDENGLYIRPGEREDIDNNTNSFNSQEKISKTTITDSDDFIYDSEKDGDSYAFKKAYHEYKVAILRVKILLSDSKKEKKMYQKRLMTEIGIWNDNRAAKLGAKPEGWETALDLISLGNWSKVKFVGKGLWALSTMAFVAKHSDEGSDFYKFYKFGGDEAVKHFSKHGDEIMSVLGKNSYNLKNYIDDANWIIKNGHYNSNKNGYYYFFRNSFKNGKSIFGFVGMKDGGEIISTFHLKNAKQLGI